MLFSFGILWMGAPKAFNPKNKKNVLSNSLWVAHYTIYQTFRKHQCWACFKSSRVFFSALVHFSGTFGKLCVIGNPPTRVFSILQLEVSKMTSFQKENWMKNKVVSDPLITHCTQSSNTIFGSNLKTQWSRRVMFILKPLILLLTSQLSLERQKARSGSCMH